MQPTQGDNGIGSCVLLRINFMNDYQGRLSFKPKAKRMETVFEDKRSEVYSVPVMDGTKEVRHRKVVKFR